MPVKLSLHSVMEPDPPFVPEHEQLPGRKPAIGAQMLSSPQVTAVEVSAVPEVVGVVVVGVVVPGAVVPGNVDEHPAPADEPQLAPQS